MVGFWQLFHGWKCWREAHEGASSLNVQINFATHMGVHGGYSVPDGYNMLQQLASPTNEAQFFLENCEAMRIFWPWHDRHDIA